MYTGIKKALSGMTLLAGAVSLMMISASPEAWAQRFEYTYGDRSGAEAGRGGVQAVYEGGGYVATGESFSPSGGSTADIYVVRTYSDGVEAWSRTYDIGGNDSATDIEEVLQGSGGFIVTGVTQALGNDRCRAGRDLFLLRIDRCGQVMWVRTYGQQGTAEIGWDVLEARYGNGVNGSQPGDFVVGGSTTYPDGCHLNGYLLRVDPDGNLRWDLYYDGPNGLNDYFYAIDECANGSNGSGDIVAVGGSNSYFTHSYDAWMVRVDGNDGQFHGGDQNAAAYGREGFEELRSVQELKYNDKYRGNLVATGCSSSGMLNRDVLLMQTDPSPCSPRVFRVIGDRGRLPDEGYCIRELPITMAPWASQGDVAVTGYMTLDRDRGGHGGRDVFVEIFQPGNLDPTTAPMLYGGSGTDWGWSLEPVCPDEKWCKVYQGCYTPGFIVAGFTNSDPLVDPYDPQQLYLIKTDADLEDNCTSNRGKVEPSEIGLETQCQQPSFERFTEPCEPGITPRCWQWERLFCLDTKGMESCRFETCECREEEGRGIILPDDDAWQPDDELQQSAAAPMAGAAEFSVSSYPNPVKSGTLLNVEYTLPAHADVTITVSDIAGKVLHATSIRSDAGRRVEGISTRDWPAGSYMITVKAAEHTQTKRVIVVE